MNKSIKIWLNYLIGAAVCTGLVYTIITEVKKQTGSIDDSLWQQTGSMILPVICIALMLLNSLLESYKWYLLLSWVQPVRYVHAAASYLAGIAFSVITPNRIGEYPGRILYLRGGNTFRHIHVSVSGVVSQLAGIWGAGLVGLVYYNYAFPSAYGRLALAGCIIINILIALVYWRFESWWPRLEQIKYLRRFGVYGRLMSRVPAGHRMKVLAISALRVAVFTAQYLILLKWLNVSLPLVPGYCMAALFFWVMAVVPSLALTELGIRGAVSIWIFQSFSANTIGILAATGSLWLLNLMVPALAGSILILRMKWLK